MISSPREARRRSRGAEERRGGGGWRVAERGVVHPNEQLKRTTRKDRVVSKIWPTGGCCLLFQLVDIQPPSSTGRIEATELVFVMFSLKPPTKQAISLVFRPDRDVAVCVRRCGDRSPKAELIGGNQASARRCTRNVHGCVDGMDGPEVFRTSMF